VSVRVHSLTLFALPGACDVTPGSTYRPATLQPPCLGREPRLGLRQCWDKPRALWTRRHTTARTSGVCHHHTPYSILCDAPSHLHPSGTNSRDSQNGVPKLSRNCPDWTPKTLNRHNSRLPTWIATRSQPKL
jgi:hypothetical protein